MVLNYILVGCPWFISSFRIKLIVSRNFYSLNTFTFFSEIKTFGFSIESFDKRLYRNWCTLVMPIHYNDGTLISWVHPTTSVWKLLQTNRKQIEYVAFWTRRVLNKVLYGQVPPWPGLNPHRFICHFSQKRYPFRIPFYLFNRFLNLFIPFKCCKSTVFWIWVNRKTRPFYRLFPVIKGIC